MKAAPTSGRFAQLDLIPLIDIVFQLILFFLVSTVFAVLPGLHVNLPEADTAAAIETGNLVITVQSDGSLGCNNRPVTLPELDAAVAAFDTGGTEKSAYPVRLEADAKAANGAVVSVFDVLRKNGFTSVNLRTQEAKAEK
jgi:biopolymer transport protein ExbD